MTSKTKHIVVSEVIGSNTAAASDDGNLVYQSIHPLLKKGNEILLDFKGIEMLTTAFLNAAIGQLYHDYTGDILNKYIKLANVADDDKILFKKVIQRAKEYFSNKREFESSANDAFYGG